MTINTKTSIAGIPFSSYVCNASGPRCTTYEELKKIGESNSSAIVMKTCTVLPREGNPEPRSYFLDSQSLVQSMGLPNLGYKEYIKFSSKLKNYRKPIIASVVGFTLEEYCLLVNAFQKSDIDLIEVNVSCPNIPGKPQIGYDFAEMENLLSLICGYGKKPIGLKLPPYFDPSHWDTMARLILSHEISFITCINSVGNTLIIDSLKRRTVIKPKKGLGGLSGKMIKPIALANVRAFYERLAGKVSIFGVGGITNGTDASEFLLAGADAVQIGTFFEFEGNRCFSLVNNELCLILKYWHDFDSIEKAKGQLQYL